MILSREMRINCAEEERSLVKSDVVLTEELFVDHLVTSHDGQVLYASNVSLEQMSTKSTSLYAAVYATPVRCASVSKRRVI